MKQFILSNNDTCESTGTLVVKILLVNNIRQRSHQTGSGCSGATERVTVPAKRREERVKNIWTRPCLETMCKRRCKEAKFNATAVVSHTELGHVYGRK